MSFFPAFSICVSYAIFIFFKCLLCFFFYQLNAYGVYFKKVIRFLMSKIPVFMFNANDI